MKRLRNRTSGLQHLRITYSPTLATTKKVAAFGTIDLTDAEYRSVAPISALIWDIQHIDDTLPDTNQEVLDLVSGVTSVVTKILYVDCNRTDTYTENGAITTPFKTIEDAITAATGPAKIMIAPCDVTTDLTLKNGVNLVGMGGKDYSVIIRGQLTFNPTTPNELVTLSGLYISAQVGKKGLMCAGTGTGRLYVKDVTIDKGGDALMGIHLANSGTTIHAERLSVTNTGTGNALYIETGIFDGYLNTLFVAYAATAIQVVDGSLELNDYRIYTASTALNALYCSAGTNVRLYKGGVRNSTANSNGIYIANTAVVTSIQGVFDVPAGAGKAIAGVAGGTIVHGGNKFLANNSGEVALTEVPLADITFV